MTRSISFAALFLVTGALALVLLLKEEPSRTAFAQAATASPAVSIPPRSIVNLNLPGYEQEPFFVENGKTRTFYVVPRDQWFVMTDLRVHSQTRGPVHLVTPGRGTVNVHLPYLHERERTEDDYHSNVGIAFPPGSELGILYDNPDGQATAQIDLNMTGYLRRE